MLSQVMYPEGEGITPFPALTQLGLGSVTAIYREICFRRNGILQVEDASALLPGRIRTAVFPHCRSGRAHEKCICEIVNLAGVRHPQLFLQILPHHRRCTGHVGTCHGSAAHELIAAARLGRGNVATRCSHFRFQL